MAGGITPSPPAAGGCGRRMTRTAPPRTGASSQEDGDESQWTHLPEYIVSGIFEQLRWERKASATFRLVCTSWLKLHDGLLRAIRVRAAIMPTGMTPSPWRKFEGHVTSLDCRRVFETGEARTCTRRPSEARIPQSIQVLRTNGGVARQLAQPAYGADPAQPARLQGHHTHHAEVPRPATHSANQPGLEPHKSANGGRAKDPRNSLILGRPRPLRVQSHHHERPGRPRQEPHNHDANLPQLVQVHGGYQRGPPEAPPPRASAQSQPARLPHDRRDRAAVARSANGAHSPRLGGHPRGRHRRWHAVVRAATHRAHEPQRALLQSHHRRGPPAPRRGGQTTQPGLERLPPTHGRGAPVPRPPGGQPEQPGLERLQATHGRGAPVPRPPGGQPNQRQAAWVRRHRGWGARLAGRPFAPDALEPERHGDLGRRAARARPAGRPEGPQRVRLPGSDRSWSEGAHRPPSGDRREPDRIVERTAFDYRLIRYCSASQ
eukprot:1188211-Prorocentrum_minimum.AAC.1